MKYLVLILAIISPIWGTSIAIADEETTYNHEEKEILVKYKDEAVEAWGNRLFGTREGYIFKPAKDTCC
ncbi:hypothetical protein JCM14036_16910 [Desulfotomaculum defluvii]